LPSKNINSRLAAAAVPKIAPVVAACGGREGDLRRYDAAMSTGRVLLKDLIDVPSVTALAAAVATVQPDAEAGAIVEQVFDGEWPDRELKQRTRHIAIVLHGSLPPDYTEALAVLRRAATGVGELGFTAMAFNDFVEAYGVEYPDVSLAALEQFTTLVSAEFAVRPFIERYPDLLFAQLLTWTRHEDWRVRRLATEGSRPRLPWGMGLRPLQDDPAPILPVLTVLRSDPSEDVRRSVANSLNDISKDHPDVVVQVLTSWQDGSSETDTLTKHALRTLLKKGHPGALGLLGFSSEPDVAIREAKVEPASTSIGGSVQLTFEVVGTGPGPQRLMIDFAVEFQNVSGTGSRKVFKGTVMELAGGDHVAMRRKISLRPMSTRAILAGPHFVEIQVNGRVLERLGFTVTD
jgi:3-methyladenine DNA glycosylase AlkC